MYYYIASNTADFSFFILCAAKTATVVQLLVVSPGVMRGSYCKQTGSGLKKTSFAEADPGPAHQFEHFWGLSWTGRIMVWRRPSVCLSFRAL